MIMLGVRYCYDKTDRALHWNGGGGGGRPTGW